MITRPESGTEYFGLIVCGALFICGSIVGTAAAGFAGGTGVSDSLTEFLAQSGQAPVRMSGFFSTLFNDSVYHLVAIFLGFSALGVFCVPLLAAVRGFFLCFSISAIVHHFGGDGILLSLAISGVTALLTIPCLFILSVQSFTSSLNLLRSVTTRGGSSKPYGGRFFVRTIVCIAVLMCSAMIDTLFVPRLIGLVAERIG